MSALSTLFELHKIKLFKNLSSHILAAIASEAQIQTYNEGDTIFSQQDIPQGLYCIITGEVEIVRNHQTLSKLKMYDHFGELALISSGERTANAIAKTDCSLLFLDKSTFDRMTDDMPEMLKIISIEIIKYLRSNLQKI